MGSTIFINKWLYPWMLEHYGEDFGEMTPHGVIVLDTIMEYNTSSFSQQIPAEMKEMVKQTFNKSYTEMYILSKI